MKPIEAGCQAVVVFVFQPRNQHVVGKSVTVVRQIKAGEYISEIGVRFIPDRKDCTSWLAVGDDLRVGSSNYAMFASLQLMRIDGFEENDSDKETSPNEEEIKA